MPPGQLNSVKRALSAYLKRLDFITLLKRNPVEPSSPVSLSSLPLIKRLSFPIMNLEKDCGRTIKSGVTQIAQTTPAR